MGSFLGKQRNKDGGTDPALFFIDQYDTKRDGESVGILWADGLLEMMGPLYVETLLHPKVIGSLVAIEAFILPFSLRQYASSSSSPPSSSHWIATAALMVPPAIFLVTSSCIWIIVASLKIYYHWWDKSTRIENAFTSSKSSYDGNRKTILGQWVLRSRQPSSSKALGCVTLYEEHDDEDDAPKDEDYSNNSESSSLVEATKKTNSSSSSSSSKKVVWLCHLTVAPHLRRHGWGDRLASTAEAKAREYNATSIRILVGNVRSKPFWLQRGYKPMYPKWTLLGHESLYMQLDII